MKRPSARFSAAFSSILIVLTIVFGCICAPATMAHSLSLQSGPFDFGNQTFVLDHETLHFQNGLYRSYDGRHVARLTNRSVNHSLTRAAAILIDSPSGSGIFSYVIGAARAHGKESYGTPIFLGDRIRIETVKVNGEVVTIYYLDHPAHTPAGLPPTKPVTVTYVIQADGSLH